MHLPWNVYYELTPTVLRKAREKAGLSIEEAAARSPVHQLTIENYERGRNLPWLPYFLQLLDLYGLDFCGFHELAVDEFVNRRHKALCERVDGLEQRLEALGVSLAKLQGLDDETDEEMSRSTSAVGQGRNE